jgi:hypothetical protein
VNCKSLHTAFLTSYYRFSRSVGASVAKAYIYIQASLGIYTEDAIRMLLQQNDSKCYADYREVLLTGISIWNLIEVQIVIIAACGPMRRPILTRILPIESIRSLVSSLRSQKATKQATRDVPSFVKMESDPNLGTEETDSTQNLTPGDSYELVLRAENSRQR